MLRRAVRYGSWGTPLGIAAEVASALVQAGITAATTGAGIGMSVAQQNKNYALQQQQAAQAASLQAQQLAAQQQQAYLATLQQVEMQKRLPVVFAIGGTVLVLIIGVAAFAKRRKGR